MHTLERQGLDDVTSADLGHEAVELLPSRTAPGAFINIVTMPAVNISIAVSAASIGSLTSAHALQGLAVLH
jgi:hypothetical protein